MDADVYGPSIPHLVGAQGQPAIRQIPLDDGRVMERIIPIEADGLKLMSMGFMLREDQAVIWRGPMLHKALTQFLQQTDWGQLDYLIIDMPPGTGDVAITLSRWSASPARSSSALPSRWPCSMPSRRSICIAP